MAKIVLVAAAALVDGDGRVLLCQRPKGKQLAGLWEFPGGKVEAGETPEACAVREVREEVGLTVGARSRRARIEHSYSERSVVLYPVDCDFVGGELRLLEVSDARWVLRHELLTLTFPEANRGLIAELVAEVAPPRDGRAE